MSALWRWCQGFFADAEGRSIPGVVYSDQLDVLAAQEKERKELQRFGGTLHNIRLDNAPDYLLRSGSSSNVYDGPEKEPYTYLERIGLAPVHPSRIRQRQYYMPITDFGLYDYDEIAPEEKELTARWMAKVMEFNGAVPAGILCAAGCLVLPLHTVYRMPLLVAAGITGVAVEVTRSYMAASRERQDLDDFILCKEIWYIKNVETYQLNLPRIPRTQEAEFQKMIREKVLPDV